MKELREIRSREEIQLMVDSFYNKVNQDELLSPVFNDFAGVNWEKHLPVMYDFWSAILLGDTAYKGNPFMKHIPLPIEKAHFDRWMQLFLATIDEHFTGAKAEEAKQRASTIAGVFQFKLQTLNRRA